MAKLRIGILPHDVETGKLGNDLDERTWKMFKNNDIENELHFICTLCL